jgi:hypothetical protein
LNERQNDALPKRHGQHFKALLITATALALMGAALAQPPAGTSVWLVAIDRDETRRVVAAEFVDADRIEIDGHYRRAWDWFLYAPGHGEHERVVTLGEYDCRDRRMRVVQTTRYSRAGDAATARGFFPTAWRYTVPGSYGDSLLTFVCSNAIQRSANEQFIQVMEGSTMESVAEFLFQRPAP